MNQTKLALIFFVLFSFSGYTKTIFVNASLISNVHDGSSWNTAFTDLHLALDGALYGDEIWVTFGVYKPSMSGERNKSFILNTGIKIFGGFNGNESDIEGRLPDASNTVLDGEIGDALLRDDNSLNILQIVNPDQNNLLDGLTFINGYASIGNTSGDVEPTFNGGAIYVTSDFLHPFSLKLMNCHFLHNSARTYGGAIFVKLNNIGENLTIERCKFEYNTSDFNNTAIYIYLQDSKSLTNILIENTLFLKSSVLLSSNYLDFNHNEVSGSAILVGARDSIHFISNKIYSSTISCGTTILSISKSSFQQGSRLLFNAQNAIIHASLFSENNGLFFEGTSNLTIQNSIFLKNENSGIHLMGDKQYTIVNNSFINNREQDTLDGRKRHFVFMNAFDPHVNIQMVNNLFYNQDTANILHFNINLNPDRKGDFVFKNNIFKSKNCDLIADAYIMRVNIESHILISPKLPLPPGIELYYEDTLMMNHFTCDDSNIFIDKLNDFTLTDSFPFIDDCAQLEVGNNEIVKALSMQSDYLGNPRIKGTTVDIGAVESDRFFGLDTILTHNISCHGVKDGSIQIVGSGQTKFSLWSDGHIVDSFEHLTKGIYKIVYAGSGCIDSTEVTIVAPDTIIEFPVVTVSCDSLIGGHVMISASGGTPPLSLYSQGDPIPFQFDVHQSGTVLYSLKDKNNCVIYDSVEIDIPTPIGYEKEIAHVTNSSSQNGKILIHSIRGGLGPYTILWNDGDTSFIRSDLSTGLYHFQLMDVRRCFIEGSVMIISQSSNEFEAVLKPTRIEENKNFTTLAIHAGYTQSITIQLIDVASRLLYDLSEMIPTGMIDFEIPIPNVAGMYIVILANKQGYRKGWKVLKL